MNTNYLNRDYLTVTQAKSHLKCPGEVYAVFGGKCYLVSNIGTKYVTFDCDYNSYGHDVRPVEDVSAWFKTI